MENHSNSQRASFIQCAALVLATSITSSVLTFLLFGHYQRRHSHSTPSETHNQTAAGVSKLGSGSRRRLFSQAHNSVDADESRHVRDAAFSSQPRTPPPSASYPTQSPMNARKRVDPYDPSPRSGYLSWDDYFMAVAFLSSQRSKDPNKQVGACIVSAEQVILGIGYNGFPRGCPDSTLPWAKKSATGDPLDTKYPYVVHAEANALLNKNAASVKGARVYVTMFPCNECAKLLIQAGITEVVFHEGKVEEAVGLSAGPQHSITGSTPAQSHNCSTPSKASSSQSPDQAQHHHHHHSGPTPAQPASIPFCLSTSLQRPLATADAALSTFTSSPATPTLLVSAGTAAAAAAAAAAHASEDSTAAAAAAVVDMCHSSDHCSVRQIVVEPGGESTCSSVQPVTLPDAASESDGSGVTPFRNLFPGDSHPHTETSSSGHGGGDGTQPATSCSNVDGPMPHTSPSKKGCGGGDGGVAAGDGGGVSGGRCGGGVFRGQGVGMMRDRVASSEPFVRLSAADAAGEQPTVKAAAVVNAHQPDPCYLASKRLLQLAGVGLRQHQLVRTITLPCDT